MDIEIQSDGKSGGIILHGSREIGRVSFQPKENTDVVFAAYSSHSLAECECCEGLSHEVSEKQDQIDELEADVAALTRINKKLQANS